VARRDIVVLGASAGGIEALTRVLKDAGGVDATFVVVVHLSAGAPTVLPHIVTRATGFQSHFAGDGEELIAGTVLIAPPGRHTLVCRGTVAVVNAPRENRSRPAIDPLFRSAAAAYGPRVIAVALSGVLDDGTAGAGAVRRNGGLVVVQSPEDALFADIPRNILEHVGADHVRPSAEIGALLRTLTGEEVEDRMAADDVIDPALADQSTLLGQAEPEGQAGLVRRTAEPSRAPNTPGAAARLEHRAREIDARMDVIREVLDHVAAAREEEAAAASASGSA
jgi:two-component system chemotaxis response regulator CheB